MPASPERIFYIRQAMKSGMGLEEIHALTGIDPWFLQNIAEIIEFEHRIAELKIQ